MKTKQYKSRWFRPLAHVTVATLVLLSGGCALSEATDDGLGDNEIFLKRNKKKLLTPATPEGKLWPRCDTCTLEEPDIPQQENFSMILVQVEVSDFKKKDKKGDSGKAVKRDEQVETKTAQNEPLSKSETQKNSDPDSANVSGIRAHSVARAAGTDGYCHAQWVYHPGVGWVLYYDPNDPDCPPQ